ncbi:MAG: hypothetical protein ABI824_02785 [Acidobacteriota bacterium]
MKNRYIGAVLAMGGLLWMGPVPVSAEKKYTAPRIEKGSKEADLQGIWEANNTAQYSLEWHSGGTRIRPGKSFITDTTDGMIPYTAAGRAKQQSNFKNRFDADTVNHCYMTGVPRFVTSGYPFQIFQTAKYIVIASEYTHMLRYVYMARNKHTYQGLDFWNGDSIGHWEGDTLVVDTQDFNDQTWLDASGNHHSGQLKVVERFTRTSADTMDYKATLTDPATYTKPFTIQMTLNRNPDKFAQLMEYECHSYAEDDQANSGQ